MLTKGFRSRRLDASLVEQATIVQRSASVQVVEVIQLEKRCGRIIASAKRPQLQLAKVAKAKRLRPRAMAKAKMAMAKAKIAKARARARGKMELEQPMTVSRSGHQLLTLERSLAFQGQQLDLTVGQMFGSFTVVSLMSSFQILSALLKVNAVADVTLRAKEFLVALFLGMSSQTTLICFLKDSCGSVDAKLSGQTNTLLSRPVVAALKSRHGELCHTL